MKGGSRSIQISLEKLKMRKEKEIKRKVNEFTIYALKQDIRLVQEIIVSYFGERYTFRRRRYNDLTFEVIKTIESISHTVTATIDLLDSEEVVNSLREWNQKFPIALQFKDFKFFDCLDKNYEIGSIYNYQIAWKHKNYERVFDGISGILHYAILKRGREEIIIYRENPGENITWIHDEGMGYNVEYSMRGNMQPELVKTYFYNTMSANNFTITSLDWEILFFDFFPDFSSEEEKETVDTSEENNNESLTSYRYNTISEKINKGILKKIIWEEGGRVFTAVKVNGDDDNTFGLYEINYGTIFEEPVSFFAYDRESLLNLLNNHMMSDQFKLFSVEFCEKSD